MFGMTRDVTLLMTRLNLVERALLGSLVFAYMVFLALMILVLKVVTRPLKKLSNAAKHFARGDFAYRVAVPTSIAELGVLAQAFNNMGEELEKQHNSLEAYSHKLEEANKIAGAAVDELSQRHREQKIMIEVSLEANNLALPEDVVRLVLHRLDLDLDLESIGFYLPIENNGFELQNYPDLPMPDESETTDEVKEMIRLCHESREIQHMQVNNDDSDCPESGLVKDSVRKGERIFIPFTTGLNVTGVLKLAAPHGAFFDCDTIHFCRHFISHMEVIIRNKALYQETVRRSHELERINQISRAISSELDMDPLLRDVVEHTQNTIHAECAFVGLLEGSRLQIRYITPGVAHVDQWVLDVDTDRHLVEIIRGAGNILVNDLSDDDRVTDNGFIVRNEFKSFVGCPIVQKGEVLGIICGFSRTEAAFTSKDAYFLELLAGQVAIALNNATLFEGILARDRRRDHQLSMAQKFQENRIPAFFKQDVAAMSCKLRAADELAGDFCDVFALGRHSIAMVIGDVANKGVAASLMTFSLLSMFRNVAKSMRPPCEVLETINKSLISQIKEDAWFATSFYGKLNTKTYTLTYASAGHEQPVWYHAAEGEVSTLQASGYPLGLFKSFPYETREVQLQQGDRIILYTDGITDALDRDGDRFGHQRLFDLIRKLGHLPADKLNQRIIEVVEEFTGGRKQKDDIILAVLELQDDPYIYKTIVYGEADSLINEILEALTMYELNSQTHYAIRLAIDEALANAWRHGLSQQNDLPFEVSYCISDEGFRFRVKDPGDGFDHESLPDPTVEENLYKTHGRGVFLIRQMMDEVEFNETGNEISVFQRFTALNEMADEAYDTLLLEADKQLESLQNAKSAESGDSPREEPAPSGSRDE
jgi:sigma-B regulation protein RsbU (phosphoserine phosphatase)